MSSFVSSIGNKYLLVLFLVVGMGLWVFSGELLSIIGISASAEEASLPAPEDQAEEVALVRGIKSTAQPQTIYLEVRGQTRANRVVQVRSEISGKIVELPGEKGSFVKAGDLLCRIAEDARRNEYDEAQAELHSRQLEHDGIKDLNSKGLQSEILVAKALAALEESKTRARHAELALENTSLAAPFDGVVESQFAEVGDYLTPGASCVSMMEINPILIAGQVSEKNISRVSLHGEVAVSLITGDEHRGVVSFIGHAPDMATRTFPIEVTVANPDAAIRAGITSSMRVPVGNEVVHLISPASLLLNDLGVVGVHVMDDESRVRFMAIEVVVEGPTGVMVKGLPKQINLITVGQEEVVEGQIVRMDFTPIAAFVGF